jgi:hypothetical protein
MKVSRVRAWIDDNANVLYSSMLIMLCAFVVWHWRTHGLKFHPRFRWTVRVDVPNFVRFVGPQIDFSPLELSVLLAFGLILSLWIVSFTRKNRQLAAITAARDSLDLNTRDNSLNAAPGHPQGR